MKYTLQLPAGSVFSTSLCFCVYPITCHITSFVPGRHLELGYLSFLRFERRYTSLQNCGTVFTRSRFLRFAITEQDLDSSTSCGAGHCLYRHFTKLLLASDLASSTFARELSSFEEAVIKDGTEAQYTDSIQLLASYFVHQKWIAPHVKPVIVSECCYLVTKFRADKVSSTKDWVSSFFMLL